MTTETFDVLIVGAGVSGIGAAWHLQKRCPGKSYAILEARSAVGGTWDLFRYPGIRSDSDMSTFGYAFRPWAKGKVFADGPGIKSYVTDTAAEYGIDQHIRFGERVVAADWQSASARWTLTTEDSAGAERRYQCHFLIMGSGYYRYDAGYRPHFDGEETFKGPIIHPQHWPEDLDYKGKKVAVIGSGATAVTLVPAMADSAAHVTMVQRSPTYIVGLPAVDRVAGFLKAILPDRLAYALTRWKNIILQMIFYAYAQAFPEQVRKRTLKRAREDLGEGFDVERHFNPRYKPWDQRFCVAPDSDFFTVLRKGEASVVTDHIDRFEPGGIRLKSGELVEADIIIPATGLSLQIFGGVAIRVDGQSFRPPGAFSYRGMMYSGLPNLAAMIGYTNASWTLKVDLSAERVCRLLNHMDRQGYAFCVPVAPEGLEQQPLLNLDAGYINRAASILPKQATRFPWRTYHNYLMDMLTIRYGRLEDGALQFFAAGSQAPALPTSEAAASA